jgi:hypothetical protein
VYILFLFYFIYLFIFPVLVSFKVQGLSTADLVHGKRVSSFHFAANQMLDKDRTCLTGIRGAEVQLQVAMVRGRTKQFSNVVALFL